MPTLTIVRLPACVALVFCLALTGRAQFLPSPPSHDYNDPANWTGGMINGQFSGDMSSGYATTGIDLTVTTGLSFNHTGSEGRGFQLRADGTGDRAFIVNGGTIATTTAAPFGAGTFYAILGQGTPDHRLAIDIAGTTTLNVGTNTALNFQNDTTISGNVTKTGAGYVDAIGHVTVTGSLAINQGGLVLSGGLTGNVSMASGALVRFSNGSDLSYGGVITGVGTLLKTEGGVLTLTESDPNTGGHSGSTIISQGTVRVAGAWSPLGGTAITIASGATLDLQQNIIFSGGSLAGTGTLNFNGGFLAASGTRTVNNAYTLSGAMGFAGSGNLTLTQGATLAGATTVNVSSTGSTTLAGVLAGAGSLTKSGSGALALAGANTFSGGTTINAGLIEFSSSGNLGAGAVTLNGGGLRWATGSTADVSAGLNPVLGSGGGTFDTNGNSVGLSAAFSGGGALVKAGAGTLTLSGAATYTGATTVSGGTLAVGSAQALPAATALTVSSGASLSVGFDQTVRSLTGGGTVQIDSGRTFGVDGTTTTVFSGTTSGAGTLAKAGTGTLTLTGANTHSGGTAVSGGILAIGNGGTTGSLVGNISVSAGSTVQFNRSDASTYAGVVSGAGTLSKQGAGVLTLTGANTHTGGTTIGGGGTVAISSDANLGATANILTLSGGTLRLDASPGSLVRNLVIVGTGTVNTNGFDLALGGAISGTGGLTKANSAGTLTLSGANSYAGSTVVGGGTLATGAANVLGGTSLLALSNAAQFDMQHSQTIKGLSTVGATVMNLASGTTLTLNGTGSVTGAITGGGGIVKNGLPSSTLNLVGTANTYSGGTIINGGFLRVGNLSGSATGSGPVTINATANLRGGGFIAGTVTINSGGTLGGGATSAGTLTLGGLSLNPGAVVLFNLNNGLGAAGTSGGWSLLNLTGELDLNGTTGSPMTLKLATINNTTGQAAAALNFDALTPATFLIASAAGGITGFDASAWTFDTSAFVNAYTGAFTVSQTGNNLYLNYTAIPEPSTAVALAGLLAFALAAWRRHAAQG